MNDSRADSATPKRMTADHFVRIATGSRLHFGLLDTMEPFGGVGVMIDQPKTEVAVFSCDRFVCDDQDAPRLRAIAERAAQQAQLSQLPRCRIEVTRRAPAHSGLGSGTQLAMAAAEAVCCFLGLQSTTPILLRAIAARGKRSAVGVHGYCSGGLIFEDAERVSELNPLKQRVALPASWCVGIFRPTLQSKSISGSFEREQFARLSRASVETRAELSEIITRRMLPAAQAGDFEEFADSVHKYNETSGLLFTAVQNGPYNGTAVTDVVHWLRQHQVLGVGQSSWGPGVFGWFDSMTKARALTDQLPTEISLVAIASPQNSPRQIARGSGPG